jgi:starch-binding outer membrane protein, SusD/RagB family
MIKNKINKLTLLFGSLALVGLSSCTDLTEEALDGTIQSASSGTVDTKGFLSAAKNGLNEFASQANMYALDEMSTDVMAGPTRGGDWDDNGAWRQIHMQSWTKAHVHVRDSWNILLSNVYNCNQVIDNSTVPSDVVEAKFLKAFYYYHVIDLFGQVPYREKGQDVNSDAKVWTRTEATTKVIELLESIVSALPARAADASAINKDAAHFLLAKLYLNKGVFTAADATKPTFVAADMNKVIEHVNLISSSLATDYWDNFKPTNDTSPEILFSRKNTRGEGSNMQSRWRMGTHYNQSPSGWNGFAVIGEFYNTFDPTDRRIKNNDSAIISQFGNGVGILVGQVRNGKVVDNPKTTADETKAANVEDVLDRNGNKLIFTDIKNLIISGTAIEGEGYRPMKYIPDAANLDNPENDYVLFRYADALLMKAEAVLRGGTPAGASVASIQSDLAGRAGITTAIDLSTEAGIYKARGNELWLEGWRRNDMIRFGKYLAAKKLKTAVSDAKVVLFPIPANALLNPNLKQNPGY